MAPTAESPQLKILHVLTLNGRNGEYGGPVRVARELCQELNSRGHKTHIFSGALLDSEPTPNTELTESFIHVKPITQKLKVSSLWSWKMIPSLKKLISNSDVIHIHFARDLIPFLAAFLAIILRKPFITQTHGMIISDGRFSTSLVDFLMTRPLMNRSRTNLVLTKIEHSAVLRLNIKSNSIILPNGIAVKQNGEIKSTNGKKIIFCSRLERRKGVLKFLELADKFRASGLSFEVYGPDGGELQNLNNEILSRNLEKVVKYKGSLLSGHVQYVLSESDLLVLPSKDEPFPMIVLEALAVGTPVLVMPSCGLSDVLKKLNQNFVATSESLQGIIESFQNQDQNDFKLNSRSDIRHFCEKYFSIAEVGRTCLDIYFDVSRIR